MDFRTVRCAAALLAMSVGSAGAVTLGMVDTFEGGSTDGWFSGGAHPQPPVALPDGGPGGAGDGFLQITALGGSFAGSKLNVFSGPQWGGDYVGAGVTSITMHANNLGATDLSLRLYFEGPAGNAFSLTPVFLAAGSGWTPVQFDLDDLALDLGVPLLSTPADVLANVNLFRLYHGVAGGFPSDSIVATLGIDNVTAVPEPAGWAMFGAGLAALLLAAPRLRRRV